MNDKLYNDLLEYCSGDLDELEATLDYFRARLESDREVELEKEGEDEDGSQGCEEDGSN